MKILELGNTKKFAYESLKKEELKIKTIFGQNEKNTGLRFLHDIVTGKKTEKKTPEKKTSVKKAVVAKAANKN